MAKLNTKKTSEQRIGTKASSKYPYVEVCKRDMLEVAGNDDLLHDVEVSVVRVSGSETQLFVNSLGLYSQLALEHLAMSSEGGAQTEDSSDPDDKLGGQLTGASPRNLI